MDVGRITQWIQICGSDSNKPNFHIEYMSRKAVGRALFLWVMGTVWHRNGAGHHGGEWSSKPAHPWQVEQQPCRHMLHSLPKIRAHPLPLFIQKTFYSEKLSYMTWGTLVLCCLGGNRQRRKNQAQGHLSFFPKPTISAPVPGDLSREPLQLGKQWRQHHKGQATDLFSF